MNNILLIAQQQFAKKHRSFVKISLYCCMSFVKSVVQNDILLAMDGQHVTLLVLLDLSAAFDTVDHQVLLRRL